MVSTYGGDQSYQADLVRVFSGDAVNEKFHVKINPIEAPFNGQYVGNYQPTYPESYVEVPDNPVLNNLKSFTVQSYLWTSLLRWSDELAYPNVIEMELENVRFHDQTLVSRFDNSRQFGWSLYIDVSGTLAFKVGDSSRGAVYG